MSGSFERHRRRAKEAGLTAIELLDGPGGAAYVQLTNVLVSGKIEMRVTGTSDTPIDHGSFDKLDKIAMGAGGMLERGADGVLRYTGTDGHTVIVVPMNAKFDRRDSLTPAELADQAVLQGEPAQNVQQIGRGVKLVFVETPDQEFAEYLLRGAGVRHTGMAGIPAEVSRRKTRGRRQDPPGRALCASRAEGARQLHQDRGISRAGL